MNLTALGLVALFCVAEATYNIVVGGETRNNPLWNKREGLFAAISSSIAAILLLIAAFFTGGPELLSGWLTPIVCAGLLVAIIVYGETKAFSLEDASIVGPISSTTPAFVIVVSFIRLHEYPTRQGWLGIMCLVAGTYLLNIQKFLNQKRERNENITLLDWFAPFRLLLSSRGVRWAFLVAMLGSVAMTFEAQAVRLANVAFASALIFGMCAILNWISTIVQEGRVTASDLMPCLQRPRLIVAGLCMFAAVFFANTAFRYDIVPYVGTVKRFQIPLTIILAYFFLNERKYVRNRLLGATVMIIGLILIVTAEKNVL